jgi:hypothetical protein
MIIIDNILGFFLHIRVIYKQLTPSLLVFSSLLLVIVLLTTKLAYVLVTRTMCVNQFYATINHVDCIKHGLHGRVSGFVLVKE